MTFGRPVHRDDEISIRIRPRLHLGLISMHEGGPRRNGGIGFSVASPEGVVTARPASTFAVVDMRGQGLVASEIAQLHGMVDEAAAADGLLSSVVVRLDGDIRTHVGMGSGTAIRLAILEALYIVNGQARSREYLIGRSGRGGTSGVGINTYFHGGLVLDLGTKSGPADFLPSSSSSPRTPPMALPPLTMPNWPLCLCVPRSVRPKS
jgi:beta-ribofuranosylaminobenzene 5'-phosphate synthase